MKDRAIVIPAPNTSVASNTLGPVGSRTRCHRSCLTRSTQPRAACWMQGVSMRRRQPYLVDTSTQFVHFRCGCGKVCVPEGGRNHSPRTRDLHTASDASKRESAHSKQATAPQRGGMMAGSVPVSRRSRHRTWTLARTTGSRRSSYRHPQHPQGCCSSPGPEVTIHHQSPCRNGAVHMSAT